MDMSPEDFDSYIKKTTTLEERLAYVKEIKERFKKQDLERDKNRYISDSRNDWHISDLWLKFKKEHGINSFHGRQSDDHYFDIGKIFVFITAFTDLPPYCQNPVKIRIGTYDIAATDEELINESVKFLNRYDKHQNSELGIFYILKKEVKNKPKPTLF